MGSGARHSCIHLLCETDLQCGDKLKIVLQVNQHKTFASYGYARLVLLPETERLLDVYATKIRQALPLDRHVLCDEERPFFLTYHGGKVGHLRNLLNGFWRKTGLGGTICITKLRKAFTTMVSIARFHTFYSWDLFSQGIK